MKASDLSGEELAEISRSGKKRRSSWKKKTKSKHRNIRTEVDGIQFDSKLEARRYHELRILLRSGEITNLKLQDPFSLTVNGVHVAKYLADFTYYDKNGDLVVEDAKGQLTQVYKLKKKLMKAIYGIDIVEVNQNQIAK